MRRGRCLVVSVLVLAAMLTHAMRMPSSGQVVPGVLPTIAPGAWTMTSSLSTTRSLSTTTVLDGPACAAGTPPAWCGKILVAGGFLGEAIALSSAELYNPATGSWTLTKPMTARRGAHSATLLADGRVLVAGGRGGPSASTVLESAEIYDPTRDEWTSAGSMAGAGGPRQGHTAALLDGPRCRNPLPVVGRPAWCGKILVAGGIRSADPPLIELSLSSAALYTPPTAATPQGGWTATGSMALGRSNHTMTTIDGGPCRTTALSVAPAYCGLVLVAGGTPLALPFGSGHAESELYEPDLGVWVPTGPMTHPHDFHAAVLLDGPACRTSIPASHCNKILVTGGLTPRQFVNSVPAHTTAELYDPLTATWAPAGTMLSARAHHALTLLDGAPCRTAEPAAHCGKVLVSGGPIPVFTATGSAPELYDPATGIFVPTAHQLTAAYDTAMLVDGAPCRTATPSPPANCGRVLSFGATASGLLPFGPETTGGTSAELFDPSAATQPPTIVKLEPLAGPVYGGVDVVLSGAGFGRATEVRFGDQAADFRVETPERVVAISPAHAADEIAVTVTTPEGTSAVTDLVRFAFFQAGHSWEPTGERLHSVVAPSMTDLADGRVLVVGGEAISGFKGSSTAEAYDPDPTKRSFHAFDSMAAARRSPSATTLLTGEVLVAGGAVETSFGGCCDSLATAEVLDPDTGRWRSTGSLGAVRSRHTATRLDGRACRTPTPPSHCGKVLVVGGTTGRDDQALASTEIYDPDAGPVEARGAWSPGAPMAAARYDHHAVPMDDGRVFVFGGVLSSFIWLDSAAIYDPRSNSWTVTGAPAVKRRHATATLLPGGRVLLVGGCAARDLCGSSVQSLPAEIYEPEAVDPATGATGAWRSLASPRLARSHHTATLVNGSACGELCGRVVVAGGRASTGRTRSIELFDPDTGSWGPGAPLTEARDVHRAALLADGGVLAVGGDGGVRTAEVLTIVDPGELPVISSVQPRAGPPGTRVRIFGSGFSGTVRVSFGGIEVLPEVVTPNALVAVAPPQRRGDVAIEVVKPTGSSVNDAVSDADDFTYSAGRWQQPPPALSEARYLHTSTSLDGPACRAPDPPAYCGNVLVAGGTTNYLVLQVGQTPTPPLRSAELYAPGSRTWKRTATDMVFPRFNHTATLLDGPECHRPGLTLPHCGKVLVVGGQVNGVGIPGADLYDPATGVWTATAALAQGRFSHTATALADGRVLVAGGSPDEPRRGGMNAVEIYNPLTGSWAVAQPMADARNSHTATRLGDGRVLVAGGLSSDLEGSNEEQVATAEIYDPVAGTWVDAPPMDVPRFAHSSTLLEGPGCGAICGRVLVAGGIQESAQKTSFITSSELFDPVRGVWQPTGVLRQARAGHTATLLADGKVMVIGGAMTFPVSPIPVPLSTAEVYDPRPTRERWSFTDRVRVDQVPVPTGLHGASLLDGPACRGTAPPAYCGSVIISGGVTEGTLASSPFAPRPLGASDLYASAPDVDAVAPGTGAAAGGAEVVISGSNFGGASTVRFGDVAAPSFRVDSPTRITAVAPPSPVLGPVEVVVDGPGGTSALVQPKASSRYTFVGLPGAIADAGATALSNTEIELRFSSAHNGDGTTRAQDYEIRQFTSSFTDDGFAAGHALCNARCHFDQVAASYVLRVTDLTPGTTYHFGIRAVNDQGPGPLRAGVVATTKGVAPAPAALPPACPDVRAAGATSVVYPGGRYSIVGLPEATVVGSSSPLYGWFDLGAGGGYSSLSPTAPVSAGRGYWAWFACPRALELSSATRAATEEARFALGGYRASLIGNPATTAATVTGHDFAALWDPGANGGAGGYVVSAYRQPLTLAVGQGAWAFSYVPTEVRIAGGGG